MPKNNKTQPITILMICPNMPCINEKLNLFHKLYGRTAVINKSKNEVVLFGGLITFLLKTINTPEQFYGIEPDAFIDESGTIPCDLYAHLKVHSKEV